MKRYNAFSVKLTANSDTEQNRLNNISKSTFPVRVNEHFHILVNCEIIGMSLFVTKQGVFVMYGDKTRAISLTR